MSFMSCVCLNFASETKPLNIKRDVQVNGHNFFLCYLEQSFQSGSAKGALNGNLREREYVKRLLSQLSLLWVKKMVHCLSMVHLRESKYFLNISLISFGFTKL